MRLAGLGLLLTVWCAPGHAAAFAEAQFDHWAYQAELELADAGLAEADRWRTGPYICGPGIATRYEFAIITTRASDELDRQTQPGTTPKQPDKLPAAVVWLHRLAAEFAPDLRRLGADPDVLQDRIRKHAAFADVPLDHWASLAVAELAGAGVLQGYANGSFARTE